MNSRARRIVFLTISLALLGGLMSVHGAPTAGANGGPPLPDSEPAIKSWAAATFPAQLPAAVKSGSAVARIIVDEKGVITSARVLQASDPAFGAAAVAAVEKWKFSPGVTHGKFATMCMDVPFEFDRQQQARGGTMPLGDLQLVPQTEPKVQDAPLGDYPSTLAGRGLPGDVVFACVVNPDGTASSLHIIRASHADYVIPAIESSRNWRFSPATQGDLTVAAQLAGEVFYMDPQTPPREQVLAINGVTAPDGSAPAAAPHLLSLVDPVWPYDLLIAGKSGSAAVEFTVTGNGSLRDLHVKEATDPAFGAALLAAVSCWTFEGAMVNGMGTDVTLVKHAEFKAVSPATDEDAEWMPRLLKLVRAHAPMGGGGLDERLTPLYRVAPVRPEGLADEKGQADIEFIIDRDGRARLPRVVAASKEGFGWSAATAVSQWVFKAPRRHGQPTEVKVRIPITF